MGRLGAVGGRLMVVYICNQCSHLRNICLRVCVYFVYDSFKDYIQMFSTVLNHTTGKGQFSLSTDPW